MSIRGVAFDLDYTLAVTTKSRDAILRDAIASVDGPQISREAYLTAHRNNLTEQSRTPVFRDILSDSETDTDPEAMAAAYRREISDALEPLAGIEPFIRES